MDLEFLIPDAFPGPDARWLSEPPWLCVDSLQGSKLASSTPTLLSAAGTLLFAYDILLLYVQPTVVLVASSNKVSPLLLDLLLDWFKTGIIGFLICPTTTFFLSGENLTSLLNFWSMIETKLNYVRSKKIGRFLLFIMFWQCDEQGIILFPTLLGIYINFSLIHHFLDVEYNIMHEAISRSTNSKRDFIILLQGVGFNGSKFLTVFFGSSICQ